MVKSCGNVFVFGKPASLQLAKTLGRWQYLINTIVCRTTCCFSRHGNFCIWENGIFGLPMVACVCGSRRFKQHRIGFSQLFIIFSQYVRSILPANKPDGTVTCGIVLKSRFLEWQISNYYINWLNSKCEREIYKFRQLPVDDSCNKARRIHIMAALVHGNDTLKKTWHRMPSGTTFLLIIKQTPSVLHVY